MRIAVVDLETTHINEHEGSIVEVGCVLLDDQLSALDQWQAVVFPEHEPDSWPSKVHAMHADSGLLEACLSDDALPVGTADVQLATWLARQLDDGDSQHALAGSGVAHFDSRWLARWMPASRRLLTYWSYDVGVVRRFARDLCGIDRVADVSAAKPHRALDDAWLHVGELRDWQKALRGAA